MRIDRHGERGIALLAFIAGIAAALLGDHFKQSTVEFAGSALAALSITGILG